LKGLPLRVRLLLPFVLAMTALLAGVGLLLYLRLAASLSNDLDQGIRQRAGDLATVVRQPAVPLDLEASTLVERGESFAQVVRQDGAVVASSGSLDGRPLLSAADLVRSRGRTLARDGRVPGLDEPARLVATTVRRGDEDVVLVVGATKGNMLETLGVLRTQLLLGGPLTLLVASLAAYVLSGAALRPVDAMRRRAEQITASEPGKRLPTPLGNDELARLGATLNDMLGRLEAAMSRERDFVADASHELRTPLALLKTELELALRRPRSPEELRAAITSAADETDRLTRLADDLLVVARADEGKLPVRLEDVPVAELLRCTVTRFAPLARASDREIVVTDDTGVTVPGDPARLQQALDCLLDNALTHGRGEVHVYTSQVDGRLEVHVADRGPGYATEFLPHAFERFSRQDAARSGGGAGLGLALVRAIAELHGGTAQVANRAGGGADAWLCLPS
jgi:heavy metal sensor kinase